MMHPDYPLYRLMGDVVLDDSTPPLSISESPRGCGLAPPLPAYYCMTIEIDSQIAL